MAWRVSWEAEGTAAPGADRRRALPVGRYTLRGYRVQRRAEDGVLWHVSATGGALRELKVEEGKSVACDVDQRIHISGQLQGGGVGPDGARRDRQVGMQIQGIERVGLSIYRDGKRIPMGFRVLASDGTVAAQGSLRYG